MSGIGAQNPFAPPRAAVEDVVEQPTEMVEATRGRRLGAKFYHRSAGVGGSGAAIVMGIVGLVGVLGLIAFYLYSMVLVYRYGQTFGKRRLGIRVVRTDGSRVTFGRFVALRWLGLVVLGAVVGAMAAAFGLLHSPLVQYSVSLIDGLLIFGAARRCLHDYIADTRVVTAASSPNATLAASRGENLRTISF
jgi:uncharacterized RDD family membrane protein YckC